MIEARAHPSTAAAAAGQNIGGLAGRGAPKSWQMILDRYRHRRCNGLGALIVLDGAPRERPKREPG